MANLSRRQMMKISAGALLAAGLWPGQAQAQQTATKPLKFVQVNDLHYTEDLCAPFHEELVKKLNSIEGLALVLFAGDLVDTGTPGQCHALHDILAGLKMPYYVSPGNHDAASETDRAAFERIFGTKFNHSFEQDGWQFVGLDTSDGTKWEKVSVGKPTLDFAATLPARLDKSKPTFVYTHFPVGAGVTYRLVNADTLLEPFKQINVQAIFNGHFHGYTQKGIPAAGGQAIVTTNRCCSRKRANHDNTWQKGFFLVEAADGKFKRTFIEFGTDLPNSATPGNRRLPENRPAEPADKSAAWW